MFDPIEARTAERVLERLGFAAAPEPSAAGLAALYAAWCRSVPFDNVRKRIALERGDAGTLPGERAEEFLRAFLAHGTGGTCWPSSNGLFALVSWCGFDARRIAGSMRDTGERNHGSVAVCLDGADWLIDTALHTGEPLPLRKDDSRRSDPLHAVAIEPQGDTTLVHWALPISREPDFVWRILEDPVDHAFYRERYEITRAPDQSPFNASLYASKNDDDSVLAYFGPTRFRKRDDEIEQTPLDADALARSLVEEFGLSDEIVAELAANDGLR